MNPPFIFDDWLKSRRADVEALLAQRLPAPQGPDPGRLVESIRYSLLAPGKRLRPILGLAGAEAVGASLSGPVRLATAAVELVHCYSLVHDDLPAMDDDDMRRGKPSNHKVFGDAMALLAGDGLLTLAFEWIAEAGAATTAADGATADTGAKPEAFLEATRILARAAGISGMVRGQARDLSGQGPASLGELETLHAEKTAALFAAAAEIGAVVGGANPAQRQAIAHFGRCFGIAFQHADDRDDGDHAAFAADAQARAGTLLNEALSAIRPLGPAAEPLRGIAGALANTAGVTIDQGAS